MWAEPVVISLTMKYSIGSERLNNVCPWRKFGNIIRKWREGIHHFWVRILKFSAYAWFMISWSLSKFELISTTFFFIVSKGGPKKKCWKIAKTIHLFFSTFPLVPPWKLWKKSSLKDRFCTLFFRPRTSLQCFALDSRCSEAKHCRGVLGQKNKVQNPFLNEFKFWEASWNQKSSICWKFQYSNSKNGESPPKYISSIPDRDPLFRKYPKRRYEIDFCDC